MPVIYPISSLIYSVFKLQWLCGSPCHFSLSHNTGSQKNSKAYLCFLWSQRINEAGRDLRRSLGHLTAPGKASYGVRPWCSCLGPFVTLNPPRTEIAQLSEQPAPLPHCPHEEKVSPYIQSETLLSKHIPVVSCLPSQTSVRSLVPPPCWPLCQLWDLLGALKPSLLQADPAQVPQSLLTGQVLQPSSLSMSFLSEENGRNQVPHLDVIWWVPRRGSQGTPLIYRLCHCSYRPEGCWLPLLPAHTMGSRSSCCPPSTPGPFPQSCFMASPSPDSVVAGAVFPL